MCLPVNNEHRNLKRLTGWKYSARRFGITCEFLVYHANKRKTTCIELEKMINLIKQFKTGLSTIKYKNAYEMVLNKPAKYNARHKMPWSKLQGTML